MEDDSMPGNGLMRYEGARYSGNQSDMSSFNASTYSNQGHCPSLTPLSQLIPSEQRLKPRRWSECDRCVSSLAFVLNRYWRAAATVALKLGPEHLASRAGAGGGKLTYIEGWRVINLANEVFGFDGWSSEVKNLSVDFVSLLNTALELLISRVVRPRSGVRSLVDRRHGHRPRLAARGCFSRGRRLWQSGRRQKQGRFAG
jgi:hypothetical protein